MFTSAYARAMAWFEAFVAVVAAHLRTRHTSLRTASAGYRAVTFIEYALLAAIAVVVAALFRKQLWSTFDTLLSKFKADATDTTSNGQ